MKLKNKVAIIAGAGPGLGRATALLFAQEGAKVALVSRQKKVLDESVTLIEKRSGEAVALQADLTQQKECKRAMDQVVQKYGKIDILHCNMGSFSVIPFEKMSESEWDQMFAVNLKAKFLTVQSAIPHLIKNGSGSIILTAAVFGHLVNRKNMAHYNASKSAVLGLTKSLALELATKNIRVNCVCPGEISHQIHTRGLSPVHTAPTLLRGGLPEDVAFSVLYLASSDSAWITGTTLVIDGGMSVGISDVETE